MALRIAFAIVVSLSLGFLTLYVSSFLRETDNSKIALIAEAESYAARSKLVRGLDIFLDGLREVHDYWSVHADTATGEWPAYQGPGLRQLSGIEYVAWVDDNADRHFLGRPAEVDLTTRFAPEALGLVESLREAAIGVQGEAMLGPYDAEDGRRIRVVMRRADAEGFFVAEIDPRVLFEELLLDESPGYALMVTWRGQTLFERDTPATDIPASWEREGYIRTTVDSVLRVVHTPTTELTESLVTPALVAVLPLGLAVSGLLGLLVIENGRVNVRAAAARGAELKLAELNRELEQEVRDRTRDLADRNADLVTITESVSHDLRSPLNALSVNLDVLGLRVDDHAEQEQVEALHRSTSSVRQMSEILDRLVGLSMASHSTFERKPLAIKAVISEVFQQLQSVEPPPAVTLELEDLPEVEADETLVRILLRNLLGNAMRHTRDTNPRRIVVSSATTHDGTTSFCIRDNGSGLDASQAQRIFEPFEQLQVSQGSRGKGLGLGLAIAQRVVRRHGGRIWADGIEGEEAAIYFTLTPGLDGHIEG